MRFHFSYLVYFICFYIVASLSSCKKDYSIPEINTNDISDIKTSAAVSGGNVINDGGDQILKRGICWSTNANPTIACNSTVQDGNTGWFRSNITSLNPDTKYFVRAYATNNTGTGYGNELTFTTKPFSVPTLTTSLETIGWSTVRLTGEITDDGGVPVTDRGFCWCGSTSHPTIDDSHTHDGTGTGIFTNTVNNLTEHGYHIRSYATNAIGTAYGNELLWYEVGGCRK